LCPELREARIAMKKNEVREITRITGSEADSPPVE
jgi:hypothetical protein